MKYFKTPMLRLVSLLVCMAMLLSGCRTGGTAQTTETTGAGSQTEPSTQATTQPATEPAQETTVPVETTVPETEPDQTTPAETEPVETEPAATEPVQTEPVETQPSGGSTPGGTGGFTGGQTGTVEPTEPPELEVPDPGTDANPFAEYVASIPGSFVTVSIPAGEQVSYLLSGVEGMELSIADANAAVTCNAQSYAAQQGIVRFTAPEEAPVLVQIGNLGADAAEFTVEVTAPAGSEANPIVYSGSFPLVTEVIGAGKTLYYHVYGANGTTLSCDGGSFTVNGIAYDGAVIAEDPRQPLLLAFTNDSAEDKALTLEVSYPVGSLTNPAQLLLGENMAQIAADNADGFQYTWTAVEDGTLVLTMSGSNWQYVLNNLTAGVYGDLQDATVDTAAVAQLDVRAGDEITLMVNGFDPSDAWALPGGTVSFTAEFMGTPGAESNPLGIYDLSLPYTAQLEAGQTLYYIGQFYGVTLTVENAQGLGITVGETVFTPDENGLVTVVFPAAETAGRPQPLTISITNGSESSGEYSLLFTYPLGSLQNPDQLLPGESTAALAEGAEGYNYVWTAPNDGQLTVTVSGSGWVFALNNETACIYGDMHYSDADPLITSETIQVAVGDSITLMVNTYDPEQWTTPAGTVSFTAEFTAASSGPQELSPGELPYTTEEIAPGESVSYVLMHAGGYILQVAGEGAAVTVDGAAYTGGILVTNTFTGNLLTLTNTAEQPASYTLSLLQQTGTAENPAQLVLGQNSVLLEADNDAGYTYSWIAPADGSLVLTMLSPAWQYALENVTAGVYGDLCDASMPETTVAVLEVSAGDEIRLNVNGFDPADPWSLPGGTVSFTADFEENVKLVAEILSTGTLTEEWMPYVTSGELDYEGSLVLVLSGVVLHEDQAPAEYSVSYNHNASVDSVLTQHSGAEPVVLTCEAAEASSHSWGIIEKEWNPVDLSYTLLYIHEDMSDQPAVGTAENPKVLSNLSYTNVCVEADSEYYYLYTASKTGYLTMGGGIDLEITLTNLTSGASDTIWKTNREGAQIQSAPCFVAVQAGEQVLICIRPHSAGQAADGSIFGTEVSGAATDEEAIAVQAEENFLAELQPGQSLSFSCRYQGRDVKIYGSGLTVVNLGGGTYTDEDGDGVISFVPTASGNVAILTVTNNTAEAATFELLATYPLGSKANPEILGTGTHTLVSEDGNAGWEYAFRPEKDGIVKFTIVSATNGWQYTLDSGVDRYSDDANLVTTQYVSVTAGVDVPVFVGVYGGDWSYRPAGEITFSIAYEEGMGTEANPVPYDASFPLSTGKIPAGQVVYFALAASNAAMALDIYDANAYVLVNGTRYEGKDDGCASVPRLPAAEGGAVIVGIGNSAATAASFQVYVREPLGSPNMPDSFNLSQENGYSRTITLELPAGTEGYYYEYWSDFDGWLTVTVESATNGWQYQLTRLDGSYTGALHRSDDANAAASDSMELTNWGCGCLMLNTLDAAGGTITFTVTYSAEAPAAPELPEQPAEEPEVTPEAPEEAAGEAEESPEETTEETAEAVEEAAEAPEQTPDQIP